MSRGTNIKDEMLKYETHTDVIIEFYRIFAKFSPCS